MYIANCRNGVKTSRQINHHEGMLCQTLLKFNKKRVTLVLKYAYFRAENSGSYNPLVVMSLQAMIYLQWQHFSSRKVSQSRIWICSHKTDTMSPAHVTYGIQQSLCTATTPLCTTATDDWNISTCSTTERLSTCWISVDQWTMLSLSADHSVSLATWWPKS